MSQTEEREQVIWEAKKKEKNEAVESNEDGKNAKGEHWCYKCEFVGKSKPDLITHIKTEHMKKTGQ